MINYKVQRFKKGHKFYSEAVLKHTGADGVEREYQACFGQFTDGKEALIHYTMEQLKTLIPEGVYGYSLYFSPENNMVVILLHEVPHYNFIENHIANYPWQVIGCTAHGLSVDKKTPMLVQSQAAFIPLMKSIIEANPGAVYSKTDAQGKIIPGTILGTITYETLNA